MGNPMSIQNGQAKEIEPVVDSGLVVGLKRGYVAANEDGTTVGADSPLIHQGIVVIPAGAGSVATDGNAEVTATIPAVVNKMNYLAGLSITGLGATSATTVQATVEGLAIGDIPIDIEVPAGVTKGIASIFMTFPNPIPASAVNTDIIVRVPDFGTGNTAVSVAAWGFTSL